MTFLRFLILMILMSVLLTTGFATAVEWNGVGVIEQMYIYPTYAVVKQGIDGPGTAGCESNNSWSFRWDQFDPATQSRIQSLLLSAFVGKIPINVVVETDAGVCGPEHDKQFNGQIGLY